MKRLLSIRFNELQLAKLDAFISHKNRSSIYDAVLVVGIMLVALVVRLAVAPVEAGLPYVTFFPAVTLAAFIGGLRTGLLATVIGLALSNYFFPPYHSYSLDTLSQNLWTNLVFLVDGIILSLAMEAMHRFRHIYKAKLEESRSFSDALVVVNTENEQKSEELQKFASIIESTDDAVISKTLDGIIISWNPGAERMFGYSDIEAIGKPMEIIFPDDQLDEEHEILSRIAHGEQRQHFDAVRKRKDGRLISISATMSPILDKRGKIIGVSKIARDITELKQSEDRFRAAVEAAPNGMIMVDSHGVIEMLNSQITVMFGYAEKELIGQSINMLLPKHFQEAHGAHVRSFVVHPTRRMMGVGRDLSGQHKDGRQIQVEIGLSPLQINGKGYVLASVVDITQRQQTLDQLRVTAIELERANAQVEEERALLAERVMERTAQLQLANHAKDSFLATMSHEIRTPLGGMLGMMELLGLSHLNNEQNEMLAVAQTSGKSLLRIVNDILDWSKIEAGKLELAPHAASIPDMIKSVASTYAQLASDKGLMLKVEIDPQLCERHIFDPLRLSQILNNFASNAIKFTKQGGVEISAQRQASHDSYETVRFCVKDSGVGIETEQQPRLFQHYEQGTVDTARMYGGTGLGLAICRRLAELMDGTLSVESAPGFGSTFCLTVSLPLAESISLLEQPPSLGQTGKQSKEADPRSLVVVSQPISILIVDDHLVNRMLLRQQLELLGLQVQATEDGAKAFVLWQSRHFDLIITDCHMPVMDGYELTHRIREMEKHVSGIRIPIIAWTANVLTEEAFKTQAAGMDDLLTKPTELSELRVVLLKWLPKAMMSATNDPTTKTPNATKIGQVFDPSVLNTLVANRAAQTEMLQMFIDQNHIDIAALKTTLKGDDPVSVVSAAHRIKGASRMMGAKELEALSMRIEQTAKQRDMQGARAAADKLDETAKRLEAELSRFNSEG